MNVLDMIFHWARERPEQPAIIQPDMIITYKEFAVALNSVAEQMARCKLNRPGPVAVSIENTAYRLVACFALMKCGMTVALIHRGMLATLPEHGITTLVHARDSERLAEGTNIQFDERWLRVGLASSPPSLAKQNNSGETGHLIFFSSGTTGRPKKIVHTNDALLDRLRLSNVSGDASFSRALIVAGLDGSFGFFSAWTIFFAGRTACFAPLGEPMLLLLSAYGIEYIAASPRQVLTLVELAEKGGYQLSSLKTVRIGGSLVSREFVQRVRANLCPNVLITYGSTETGTVALAAYDTIANTPGAVGFVVPSAELEIVDDSGSVLDAGMEGRVRCRTPIFLKNLAANKPRGQEGDQTTWFYPGDLGHLTADGKLCISGRADDVINRGGHKLSAVDIEEALRSCPGINDAAVCGCPSGSGIDEIWAGIVPMATLNVDEFIHSLAKNTTLRMRLDASIDRVFVIERVPRTQAGKIRRNELRKMLLGLNSKSADQI